MGNTLEGQAAQVDVVIIGGGPTGLGAAHRLRQYGFENWLLLDAEKYPGGLAGSIKTAEGFRFDHGYKEITSRYEYFDKVMEKLYSGENGRKMNTRSRNNYTFIRGNLVQYPVQNNLAGLPSAEKQACVLDLVKSQLKVKERSEPLEYANLDEYLVSEWGETLSNLFFRPYIFKAWAYPTGKLSHYWVNTKIPPVDLGNDIGRLMNNEQKDPGWGCDSSTQYPSKGGMVGIWKSLTKTLPKSNIRFKNEIKNLDIEQKTILTKGGLEIKYKQLISTMPLTALLDLSGKTDLSDNLVNSSLYVVCLGLRGESKHSDITGCIFYPESDSIFHRACIFSSHDPDSVPNCEEKISTIRLVDGTTEGIDASEKPGPYWSVMLEISGGPLKTTNEATIVDDAIRDACLVGLLKGEDEIVSLHLTEMTHGYPLPTISSRENVEEALGWLKSQDIWSRGRFGAFKYDVGDLDHCLIQGVEAVDNMLRGIPEKCVNHGSDTPPDGKVKFPVFDVEPMLDLNNFSEEAITVNNQIENESVKSDTSDLIVTSDSEMSVNAGSIRDAILSEPSALRESEVA